MAASTSLDERIDGWAAACDGLAAAEGTSGAALSPTRVEGDARAAEVVAGCRSRGALPDAELLSHLAILDQIVAFVESAPTAPRVIAECADEASLTAVLADRTEPDSRVLSEQLATAIACLCRHEHAQCTPAGGHVGAARVLRAFAIVAASPAGDPEARLQQILRESFDVVQGQVEVGTAIGDAATSIFDTVIRGLALFLERRARAELQAFVFDRVRDAVCTDAGWALPDTCRFIGTAGASLGAGFDDSFVAAILSDVTHLPARVADRLYDREPPFCSVSTDGRRQFWLGLRAFEALRAATSLSDFAHRIRIDAEDAHFCGAPPSSVATAAPAATTSDPAPPAGAATSPPPTSSETTAPATSDTAEPAATTSDPAPPAGTATSSPTTAPDACSAATSACSADTTPVFTAIARSCLIIETVASHVAANDRVDRATVVALVDGLVEGPLSDPARLALAELINAVIENVEAARSLSTATAAEARTAIAMRIARSTVSALRLAATVYGSAADHPILRTIVDTLPDVIETFATPEPANIATSLFSLVATLGEAANAASATAPPVPPIVIRIASFGIDLASAGSPEEAADVIDSFAAPLGSWRAKGERDFLLSLNAFAGIAVGGEFTFATDNVGASEGVYFAPAGLVGADLSFATGGGVHVGFAVPILDVGSLLTLGGSTPTAATTTTDPVTGEEMEVAAQTGDRLDPASFLTPGLLFRIGFPEVPIILGAGFTIAPRGRVRIWRDGPPEMSVEHETVVPSFRLFLTLAVDIPIFSF